MFLIVIAWSLKGPLASNLNTGVAVFGSKTTFLIILLTASCASALAITAPLSLACLWIIFATSSLTSEATLYSLIGLKALSPNILYWLLNVVPILSFISLTNSLVAMFKLPPLTTLFKNSAHDPWTLSNSSIIASAFFSDTFKSLVKDLKKVFKVLESHDPATTLPFFTFNLPFWITPTIKSESPCLKPEELEAAWDSFDILLRIWSNPFK